MKAEQRPAVTVQTTPDELREIAAALEERRPEVESGDKAVVWFRPGRQIDVIFCWGPEAAKETVTGSEASDQGAVGGAGGE